MSEDSLLFHVLIVILFLNILNGLQVMNLIGDVKGKVAVMVDDMIDTAGWLHSSLKLIFFHLVD